jgi:phosphoglycolate phosphatase
MLFCSVIRYRRPFDPQKIKLIIFDLDGTLIDSREDLIQSVNAMLRHLQRPELPGELIASYVGDGVAMLVRRALGDPKDAQFLQQGLEHFLAYYREHKLDHTRVYDGIPQALKVMRNLPDGATRKMAVLSNKPVNPSRAIVEALQLGEFFSHVYGGNSFATKKPDPEGALAILKETGIAGLETLIVGDSAIDVATGQGAGMWTCGVTYGFAPHTLESVPPDVVVDSPLELGQLFKTSERSPE